MHTVYKLNFAQPLFVPPSQYLLIMGGTTTNAIGVAIDANAKDPNDPTTTNSIPRKPRKYTSANPRMAASTRSLIKYSGGTQIVALHFGQAK
jgi:hypothetical protein